MFVITLLLIYLSPKHGDNATNGCGHMVGYKHQQPKKKKGECIKSYSSMSKST